MNTSVSLYFDLSGSSWWCGRWQI